MFHRNRLSTSKLIWAALQTDEADIGDLVRFGRGNRFSLERLWPEYSQVDLRGITSFAMPGFFLVGRDDRHVPSVVAAEHFGTIQAPLKRLVWFETSAHNPHTLFVNDEERLIHCPANAQISAHSLQSRMQSAII